MTIALTKRVSDVPKKLPPHDFGFDIDYRSDEGPAKRVFGATYRFIEACETCSHALLGSIGVLIEPVIVLEDIKAGSIKTWFKIFWEQEGESAVKSGNAKRALATFLVEGIKRFVSRTNDADEPLQLKETQSDLHQLAQDVDLPNLAICFPIQDQNLIDIISKFESVKELLAPGDKAELVLPNNSRIPIHQSVVADIERLREEATRETYSHRDPARILIVKKPDYLGSSQWIFRYSNRDFAATIEDMQWLARFQRREVDVRPGDALKCQVRVEVAYGYSSEVISKKHHIEKISEVIEGGNLGGKQISLDSSDVTK